MNFLAFDLETARIPPNGDEWAAHRPLGISCYALAWRGIDEVKTGGVKTAGVNTVAGFGKDGAGKAQAQMSRAECGTLVAELIDYVRQGFTLLSWNGLGFDFDILAEESGNHAACCELARAHVDMMFHFFCLQGYPLGLDTAAKGMGLAGKIEGMDGSQVPRLWQEGQHERVLAYVTQDAVMTLRLAEEVAKRGQIRWHTRTGKANRVAIPAWLPVCEALALPLPKNKWIRKPMTRARFTAWMDSSR
jgi:hypothetical protein